MAERLGEDTHQVTLELDQVVHQVREEPVEDLQAGVDLDLLLLVHEHEQQVEQVLPHEVLLLVYGATDFNQQVAHLVDHVFVVAVADGLEQLALHEFLGVVRESLPEVLVVGLIACILGVECCVGDVSSQDDGGEGLHVGGEHRYRAIG